MTQHHFTGIHSPVLHNGTKFPFGMDEFALLRCCLALKAHQSKSMQVLRAVHSRTGPAEHNKSDWRSQLFVLSIKVPIILSVVLL